MLAADVQVTVVGVGADGWAGLTDAARTEIRCAEIVLGGARQLGLLPAAEQDRRTWPSPLRPALTGLLRECEGRRTVALASGDPMVSGIGTTLVELLGAERVRIVPHVSSIALARARLGWSAESTAVVTVVGRDVRAVLRELAPGRRVIVLSSDEATPAQIARLLTGRGYGASAMVVLGELGSDHETRIATTASELSTNDEQGSGGEIPRLNVVGVELLGPLLAGWAGGLPDDAFEHDGQLTKRDLRAAALARLMPVPGQLLWDIGAGAGSVGIEWMRAHPACRTVAVEADPDRAARIVRNAGNLGVPSLEVIEGAAPDALTGMPAPDAVFIGGGATRPGVVAACLAALPAGGRLVIHGVTLETETLLAGLYREHGGELTRMQLEHAAPVGTFTGWTPARSVTQWAFTKPSSHRGV